MFKFKKDKTSVKSPCLKVSLHSTFIFNIIIVEISRVKYYLKAQYFCASLTQ